MADAPTEPYSDADRGVERLLARAAAADARARARLKAVIADMFLPAETRLDDRTRATIDATLAALVATIEGELREHGARLLRARGHPALADALATNVVPVTARLWQAGLPRDPDFLRELIARVRLDLLAELLPPIVQDDPSWAGLLPRLAENADRVVATAARAVLAAENRRRGESGPGTELPAELKVDRVRRLDSCPYTVQNSVNDVILELREVYPLPLVQFIGRQADPRFVGTEAAAIEQKEQLVALAIVRRPVHVEQT